MSGIITPEARLSYPFIFEPQPPNKPDGTPKYGAALLFDEDADLTELKQAAFNVVVEKFGEKKAKELVKSGKYKFIGGSHHTIRTDVESKPFPEGTAAFINARSNNQPGVVSRVPDPNTGKPQRITDPQEIYPGAIVKALVNPYWYDVDGNRGVAWGLNAIQKIRDGERLDGRVPAEDVFEADEDAVADLSDLTEADEGETGADGGDLDLDSLLG